MQSRKFSTNAAVETLEDRKLLSAAFMEAAGRMIVRGDAGNDAIKITKNPSNASQIQVNVNGRVWNFNASIVKQIKVEAGTGNDRVEADASKGAINAGMLFIGDRGNDTLASNTGDDALIGGGDNDLIIASTGKNYLNGGYGNDSIFAGTGNDTLVGEAGNDYFSDAGGSNSINAGPGTNTVVKGPVPTLGGIVANPIDEPDVVIPPPAIPQTPQTPTTNSKNPFVIGVWSQPAWSFPKWKDRGINTAIGYESLSGTVSVEKFSAEAVKNGMFMIRHPNPDPAKDKNQPNLLAWMHNDEPDYKNVPAAKLQDDYKKLKAVDPTRPVFVNFAGSFALWGYGGKKEADYKAWMAGADWISNDLYPITAHNRAWELDAPGEAVARLAQWSGGKRQFAVIEASDQELPGRAEAYPGVTPDQFRAQVWNAVISGATGIIYFPQRIGKGFLFDAMNPQVEAEMKKVNAQLSRLGDALMTTKDPGGVSMEVDGALRVTWRKHNGKTYFVVLNNSDTSVTAQMDVKGVSASSAQVEGENRTTTIKNGTITETFAAHQVKVFVV